MIRLRSFATGTVFGAIAGITAVGAYIYWLAAETERRAAERQRNGWRPFTADSYEEYRRQPPWSYRPDGPDDDGPGWSPCA